MTPSTTRVLRDLKRYPRRGITALDYPTGFRLASRVRELRESGHKIDGSRDTSTPLWRYLLVKLA